MQAEAGRMAVFPLFLCRAAFADAIFMLYKMILYYKQYISLK